MTSVVFGEKLRRTEVYLVGTFAVRHFCGGFFYGKMEAWVNGEAEVYFL